MAALPAQAATYQWNANSEKGEIAEEGKYILWIGATAKKPASAKWWCHILPPLQRN